MTFATLCSGIGAPEAAWTSLGWTPVFSAETEPFPIAVLAARHPNVPNLGTIVGLEPDAAIDIIIAGTPCQSFSVAGRRAGLGDTRGVLVWEFLRIVGRLRPRWFVWENVPGWCAGILAAFWPKEVLQSNVYGSVIRCEAKPKPRTIQTNLARP